ncbi:MAG: hypothetical protein PHC29_07390 [Candidatus Omnitrophica bacterium]|nr:hypothetical protein [Candidatus Omnitrophota bacterium]
MKKIIIFCLLILALNISVYCGQLSKIELADGSVINGEILSYVNGVYTINTYAFGETKVAGEKVIKIESANYTLPTPIEPTVEANNPVQSQPPSYGQRLMKNPKNAAIITGLAKDPGFQQMASDPQLQAAAKKGDIQALLKNPKFMNIVNSSEVQEAVKKLKK